MLDESDSASVTGASGKICYFSTLAVHTRKKHRSIYEKDAFISVAHGYGTQLFNYDKAFRTPQFV